MKKSKILKASIVLSAIIGTTSIGVVGNLVSNSIVKNSKSSDIQVERNEVKTASTRATSNRVNYSNHTIDGVPLQRSDFLLIPNGNESYYSVYTNVDSSTRQFPSNKPSYIMIEVSGLGAQYKYPSSMYPFKLLDSRPDTRQYAWVAETPTPNTSRECSFSLCDVLGSDGWGTNNGRYIKINYNVSKPNLQSVEITGRKTYKPGDHYDLNALTTFSPEWTADNTVVYKWIQVIDGVITTINGQTTSKLTSIVPEVEEDMPLSIICEATYNGVTKQSAEYNLRIKNTVIVENEIVPTEDSGMPAYVWGIVGGIGGLVLIGVIVAVILILKKKKDQQAKASAKKMNVSRANAPRLTGGGPTPGPQGPRPVNAPAGPGNRLGPGPRPGAPASPIARPGASPQRPGVQRPSAPVPPKVTVNAPNKSLAPKRK